MQKINIPVIYSRERNINYIGKDDMYDTNDILNDMKMQMYDAFSFWFESVLPLMMFCQ